MALTDTGQDESSNCISRASRLNASLCVRAPQDLSTVLQQLNGQLISLRTPELSRIARRWGADSKKSCGHDLICINWVLVPASGRTRQYLGCQIRAHRSRSTQKQFPTVRTLLWHASHTVVTSQAMIRLSVICMKYFQGMLDCSWPGLRNAGLRNAENPYQHLVSLSAPNPSPRRLQTLLPPLRGHLHRRLAEHCRLQPYEKNQLMKGPLHQSNYSRVRGGQPPSGAAKSYKLTTTIGSQRVMLQEKQGRHKASLKRSNLTTAESRTTHQPALSLAIPEALRKKLKQSQNLRRANK